MLTEHNAITVCAYLNFVVGRGEWSASRFGLFIPMIRHAQHPLESRLGLLQGRSRRCDKVTVSRSNWKSNPNPPASSRSLTRLGCVVNNLRTFSNSAFFAFHRIVITVYTNTLLMFDASSTLQGRREATQKNEIEFLEDSVWLQSGAVKMNIAATNR